MDKFTLAFECRNIAAALDRIADALDAPEQDSIPFDDADYDPDSEQAQDEVHIQVNSVEEEPEVVVDEEYADPDDEWEEDDDAEDGFLEPPDAVQGALPLEATQEPSDGGEYRYEFAIPKPEQATKWVKEALKKLDGTHLHKKDMASGVHYTFRQENNLLHVFVGDAPEPDFYKRAIPALFPMVPAGDIMFESDKPEGSFSLVLLRRAMSVK